MSTIGYDDWVVDLAQVGAIYPFQGWEVATTIIGVVFWIGWHKMQLTQENRQLEKIVKSKMPDSKDNY
jgi:hypothetical protein